MATTSKRELDLKDFPPGTVTEFTTLVCLACIFDIFTKQLGLAPRTAFTEIKRHTPTIEELTSRSAMRPYFDSEEKHPHCPFCGSAKRWLARFDTYVVEGGKTTDAPRRALIKKLPTAGDQFVIVEKKSDSRAVLFEWLDTLGLNLDLNDETWLLDATRKYLERREPKTNWEEVFADVRAIRRSSRLTEGWERDGNRLFLAPKTYAEAIWTPFGRHDLFHENVDSGWTPSGLSLGASFVAGALLKAALSFTSPGELVRLVILS